MSTTEATPRPWRKERVGTTMRDEYKQPFGIIQAGEPNLVAGVFGDVRGGVSVAEANAELIVTAVNERDGLLAQRDALVALARAVLDVKATLPIVKQWQEQARQALKLAQEEK